MRRLRTQLPKSLLFAPMVAVGVGITLSSCATTQKIRVASDPLGARVMVKNVDFMTKTSETTPTEIRIKNKENGFCAGVSLLVRGQGGKSCHETSVSSYVSSQPY